MIDGHDEKTKCNIGFDLSDQTKEKVQLQIRYKLAAKLLILNPDKYEINKKKVTELTDKTIEAFPKVYVLLNYLNDKGDLMTFVKGTSNASTCNACQQNITP